MIPSGTRVIMRCYYLYFGLLFTSCVCVLANEDARVEIDQGTILGAYNSYFEFYGIPYAGGTGGDNRFKAPTAAPTFETPFRANRMDIRCVRPSRDGYEGIEDCLTLDVLTPKLNQTDPLPVMVWIKGTELDNNEGPDNSFESFIEKDIVIVRPNFRQSIFGFLCLGNADAPGNAGLKDIITALQWIQQNIAAFGGDSDNVTVFGHGSGAALVDLLTFSQVSEGLLHRVIAQSGTALAPWGVSRDNLKYAIEVAEALGHRIRDIESLTDAFRRTSVAALMAAINELEITDNSLPFAPCLEREVSDDTTPFLTKSPFEILSAGEQLQVPIITGFVDVEGTVRAYEGIEHKWLDKIHQSFGDFLQPDIRFETDKEEEEMLETIKTRYFQNSADDAAKINNYLTYHGDTLVLVSALREARMRAGTSEASVYLYQFSYKGSLGTLLPEPFDIKAAGHGDELLYLFNSDKEINVQSLTVSDILVERWTNFAKTGIPSSETSKVDWTPLSESKTVCLRILHDDEVNINNGGSFEILVENPHSSTITFWDDIYEKHFQDAKARWSVDEREDENDDSDNSDNDDSEDEDEPNSGSTIFGYTFGIIVLFSIMNMLHSAIIMS